MLRASRRSHLAVLAVALLGLLALSACSSETKEGDNYAEKSPFASESDTSTTPAEKLLTVVDVERVSGMKAVQSIAQGANAKATGNLNFANDKGGIFLIVALGNSDQYEGSKATDTFREAVSGVGDDAFSGPAASKSKTPNQLVFRKGKDSAALTVFFSAPDKTVLSIDQLKELANVMAERF